MLFRNPQAFAFVMLAIGTGLVAYYGEQWYRLPRWTEAEIEQSTELNLQIELQRRGPHLQPQGERIGQLRQQIRREVEAEIRTERERPQKGLAAGLVALVLGLGQLVASGTARRPAGSRQD